MKTSSEIHSPQAHLHAAFQQLVDALGAGRPSSPQDLPQLLQAEFSLSSLIFSGT